MIQALKLLDLELVKEVSLYICGGTAIASRYQARPTADVDVIEPEVFGPLLLAAKKVASSLEGKKLGLAENWLNDSVGTMVQVANVLPADWKVKSEVQGPIFTGKNLTVYSLEKMDLLRTKLLAVISADRGADAVQDLEDIVALSVSEAEVLAESRWLMNADQHYTPNPDRNLEFYEKFLSEIVVARIKGDLQ
jgi:hypothetical protein